MVDFSLASSLQVTTPADLPLTAGEKTVLWTSSELSTPAQGSSDNAFEANIEYESFDPADPSGSDFFVALEAQVEQGSFWVEAGRQNTAIRRVAQGPHRRIQVAPNLTSADEGIDQYIEDVHQRPALLKSRFAGSTEGSLRFRLVAVDFDPSGANPFISVTFSLHGRRYTV